MDPSLDDDPFDGHVAWWSFTDQTIIGHTATVLGGIGAFAAVYLLWLEMIAGDLSLLVASHPNAVTVRVNGMRAATVACYIWFSVAFMFGKGGPFRNFWLYPLLAIITGNNLLPGILFGDYLVDTFGPSGVPILNPDFTVNVMSFFLPGLLVGVVLTLGYIAVLTFVFGSQEEWVNRHMPEEYREYYRKHSKK